MKSTKIMFMVILFVSFAFKVGAFEIYGLKSGITKSEYYELTSCQNYIDNYNSKKARYEDAVELKYCLDAPSSVVTSKNADYGYKFMPYFDDVSPDVSLEWTHDDRLWRVALTAVVPSGILENIAFRNAFSDAFPGKEIKESSSTNKYGTKKYLTVFFIDDSLSDQSTNHYYSKYLTEFNNKK